MATNDPDPAKGRTPKGFAYRRTIMVLVVMLISGAGAVLWRVTRLQSRLVETMALNHAEFYSQALEEFRTLYTSEVVSRVKNQGIEVSHDYKAKEGAIPLPATLSMLLGNRIAEHDKGAGARLYSAYPFPWREESGGLQDDFDKEAWEALTADQHTPFYRFEELDGRPTLRYATADVMRASCVDCHNSHPDTPKNDWKEGDVRGVLEVFHPMDTAEAQTRVDLKGFIGMLGALTLLGFLALFIVLRKFRKESADLEKRVEARTFELRQSRKNIQESYERLRTETQEREKAQLERLRMEVQLRHAQKLESIGQLAAGIAHEINTPTQFVGDNTRFLQDAFGEIGKIFPIFGELVVTAKEARVSAELVARAEWASEEADLVYFAEEIPKAINQSLEGIERISKIVCSMKQFSHPGTEEKTLTDLNEAIAGTVTVSTNEWKYVAEMQTRFDPDLPPAPCFPSDFNQVILNIIVNAAHAIADVVGDGSDGKGTITIDTRRDGDGVEIRIGDTGTGIPEENLSKIFDPFFTTKEVGKGTGQGLAISHSVIVDKHGGTLRVQSEVGKGTTFIIRLPLESAQRAKKVKI